MSNVCVAFGASLLQSRFSASFALETLSRNVTQLNCAKRVTRVFVRASAQSNLHTHTAIECLKVCVCVSVYAILSVAYAKMRVKRTLFTTSNRTRVRALQACAPWHAHKSDWFLLCVPRAFWCEPIAWAVQLGVRLVCGWIDVKPHIFSHVSHTFAPILPSKYYYIWPEFRHTHTQKKCVVAMAVHFWGGCLRSIFGSLGVFGQRSVALYIHAVRMVASWIASSQHQPTAASSPASQLANSNCKVVQRKYPRKSVRILAKFQHIADVFILQHHMQWNWGGMGSVCESFKVMITRVVAVKCVLHNTNCPHTVSKIIIR